MPLNIDIKVNKTIITRIHIARIRGTSTKAESVNTYSAVCQLDTPTPKQWDSGTYFTHKYGDGATTLTQLAIAALRQEGRLIE